MTSLVAFREGAKCIFCPFLLTGEGGFAPQTPHPGIPGFQGPYIIHIPNITWTIRSTYYPYPRHYMDRTVHIGQHAREYGTHGPYIAQHTTIYGSCGPYLAQHARKCRSCGPYTAQHSRKWSKILNFQILSKTSKSSNGHIYNFHASKIQILIENLAKIKIRIYRKSSKN